MSALVLKISSEQLTALGARARQALGAEGQNEMADAGGRAVKRLLVDYFKTLNDERHREGGAGFYADAARSVQNPQTTGGTAVVAINKIDLAQRLLGGTIKAVNGKYLAIPNPSNPDAIGKVPADFTNLQFFRTPRGGGLKLQREVASVVGHIRTGKNAGKSRNAASIIGDVVMFWLVPSVEQKADPTVLPDEDVMTQAAFTTMDAYLTHKLQNN